MKIKHTDLPLFLELLDICTPFNLNKGTVTAFVNYCLASPFIDVQDKRFEYYLRSIGEYITFYRRADENPTESFYRNIIDEKTMKRVILASDPVTKLDTYNVTYDAMQAIIKLVCEILEIEDKDIYYKEPSILYHKVIETDAVENYIEKIAFPTVYKYLQLFDLNQQIINAIENKKALEIDFYPAKLRTLFDSYLYMNKKDTSLSNVEKILEITQ